MIDALQQIIGKQHVLLHEGKAPFLQDQRKAFDSKALAVVLPATTSELQQIVKLCAQHNIAIVPQGGNTGLVGGAVSSADNIIVSTKRMNRVTSTDYDNFSITVQAGCTLQQVNDVLAKNQQYLPIGLSVDDKCQIGGVLSTNAGGVNVLRYGMGGVQMLGLEAVLSDGTIVSDLRHLRKSNEGFDWKQLFIGTEGTNGIITAVTLKTVPKPAATRSLWYVFDNIQDVLTFYTQARQLADGALCAFEVMARPAIDLVTRLRPQFGAPPAVGAYHVLLDLCAGHEDIVQTICNHMPNPAKQGADLWQWREAIPWVQREAGNSIKHDISLPLSAMPQFLARGDALVHNIHQDLDLITFGHIGDGNLHYNVQQGAGISDTEFQGLKPQVQDGIHNLVLELGGSISAEHGIGLAKKHLIDNTTPQVELQRSMKQVLDPQAILNPNKGVV